MKELRATFSHTTSTCLFFIRACYDYIMAIVETLLIILLAFHFTSPAAFLSVTSGISLFAGSFSILLSLSTTYIKENVKDNSFFGYITPIIFTILAVAFFGCIFSGYGLYACYIGIALVAIVRPLRYTLYNSFVNSTWTSSNEDVRSLQAFNNTASSRPAKWFAALMMMIFAVSAAASGNLILLTSSIAISTVVWIVSVYYTPKSKMNDKKVVAGEKLPDKNLWNRFTGNVSGFWGNLKQHWQDTRDGKNKKFWYWTIISTLAIASSTFLHLLKDIVNAKLIGTMLLPTIRFWLALPVVMLFYIAGSTLKTCFLENDDYFSVTLIAFGVIFVMFALLMPYSAALQGFAVASFIPTSAAMMLQNWFFIAFAMFCEMWTPIITGTVVYPLQNEYFDKDEIFTIIPIITIFQSSGEIIAGIIMKIMASYNLPINTVILVVISMVLFSIAVMSYCHRCMYSSCLTPKYISQEKREEMINMRYSCVKNLSALLCFGLAAGSMFYGFGIAACAFVLGSATIFMSSEIQVVVKKFNNAVLAKDLEIPKGKDSPISSESKSGYFSSILGCTWGNIFCN